MRKYSNWIGAFVILFGIAACATLVWNESEDETEKVSAIGTGDAVAPAEEDDDLGEILSILQQLDARIAYLEDLTQGAPDGP